MNTGHRFILNLLSIINLTVFIFITAPEAESDPRNYVLLPMEDLVEHSRENTATEEVTNYIIFHMPTK